MDDVKSLDEYIFFFMARQP